MNRMKAIETYIFNYHNIEDKAPYLDTVFSLEKLPNLTDEDEAVKLIKQVMDNKGFIVGVTDYDSDGLNSAAVIYKTFEPIYTNFQVIHNKRKDGNGFNPVLLHKIKQLHDQHPIDLIITADHGSSDENAFKELKEYGIKHIIVTDHHEIPKDNPPTSCDVFINPQKSDTDPKEYCGCATIFKVLSNLYKDRKELYNTYINQCLPYVAIATISDVMCLKTPYNRLIVRAGIQIMNRDNNRWDILKNKLQIGYRYNYKDIGYKLAPFINTGNRVNQEEVFFTILTTNDFIELEDSINTALKLSEIRKIEKNNLLKSVLNKVQPNDGLYGIYQILDSELALNGVIASSLGEAINKPVSCFTLDKDKGILSGSVRGILDYIDIAYIFNEMNKLDPNLFISFGGHKGAGGCSIKLEKFETYRKLFEEVVSKIKIPEKEITALIMDINTKYITYGIVEEIDYFGPYGKNWEQLLLRGLFKVKYYKEYNDSMLFLTLITQGGVKLTGTYFYKNSKDRETILTYLHESSIVRLTFEPQFYRKNNTIRYTLNINHIEGK